MKNDGGAAFPICKNCGRGPNDHTWVTRHCSNGTTYEEYEIKNDATELNNSERDAMLAAREK